mmetsp:Transcript_120403/g.239621  ORF Transcript_120403/g.239621 Transcript_120403/m.239621 type:complete len:240 (+) Transcript_120403:159-878(+)
MGAVTSTCCKGQAPPDVKVVPAPIGDESTPDMPGFDGEDALSGQHDPQEQHSCSSADIDSSMDSGDHSGHTSARGPSKIDAGQLRGLWLDKSNGHKPICRIKDHKITWYESGNSSTFTIVEATNKLAVTIDGKQCTASLVRGSLTQLTWSDGCVWVLDELQGQWAKTGNKHLGAVRDGQMYWDSKFEHPPSRLTLSREWPFNKVKMQLGDKSHTSTFNPGPPGELKWDDGEIWLRSTIF